MERILDFSNGVDVKLFDDVVTLIYNGSEDERRIAQHVLTRFQQHPNAWQRVPEILERANAVQSQFFAVQVLDRLIQTRWKVLSEDQKQGIRNFIVNIILRLVSDELGLRKDKTLLNKLNLTLIQILKQEWPQNWLSFIPELIRSSKSSLTVCENNMVILRLLSEELFDFSADQMTQNKARNLKHLLEDQFGQIFQLCQEVLEKGSKVSLIKATLEALLRFLSWIPLNYVFNTSLIDMLLTRFLESPDFRNLTLKCLSEIAALDVDQEYDPKFVILFAMVMNSVNRMIPPTTDIAVAYESADNKGQELVLNIVLFLSNFLSFHLHAVETPRCKDVLLNAHLYLIKLTQVQNREVFKICIEYWIRLVADLYEEIQNIPIGDDGLLQTLQLKSTVGLLDGVQLRKDTYVDVFSNLRLVLIERMVKPEEVILVETEEGEVVREFMKDSDTINLYKSIRELLVYLTHLDVIDTESILIEKLSKQIDGSEWSLTHLNSLCWAVGSISGAMDEETEKRFLITVIKDLLGLCEMKSGKENKAIIASNIMYIVGQYPRFLNAHWSFLKTVMNKLFEFMRVNHEGVQEMACDTLLKVAQKCSKQFAIQQMGEPEPYIHSIMRSLPIITQNLLQQPQVLTLYEAVGHMISVQPNDTVRKRLIKQLMEKENALWDNLMSQAGANLKILNDMNNLESIAMILKVNSSVCISTGPSFLAQLGQIYLDMLGLYKSLSNAINEISMSDQSSVSGRINALRIARKDILKLIATYFKAAQDVTVVSNDLMPPLLNTVLGDFSDSTPISREAEVFNLLCTVASRLEGQFMLYVPVCFDAIFESTLHMINKDFTCFPEHRIAFFKLLRAINRSCFNAFLSLSPAQLDILVDSIIWAIKHPTREVAELGLNLCTEFLDNFSRQSVTIANEFYQKCYLRIIQDVIWVLADGDHKNGFHLQSELLAYLIRLVETEQIHTPLFNSATETNMMGQNSVSVRKFCIELLHNAFPGLNFHYLETFVNNLFPLYCDLGKFRSNWRDFLVELKDENSGSNDFELFATDREMQETQRQAAKQIPGRLGEMEDEDD